MQHRRMQDSAFRQSQVDGLWDQHVAPLNTYVESLRDQDKRGWVPYIAPIYGGVSAALLSVFRDPGPKTNESFMGSGFLCCENDDATAELLCTLLDEAGIPVEQTVPWNAYPWYINRTPTSRERTAGVTPLRGLLDLLPDLRVVMLHGGDAHDTWRKLERRHPELVYRYRVLKTYHTSRQAFIGTADVRAQRMEHLRSRFALAAAALR